MNLIEDLKWRYATKKMNGQPVDDATIKRILEATQLSASSFGLQPYHILVVKNQEIKKHLLGAAYNQSQIVDSSQLLIFCIWDGIKESQIHDFIADIAKKRNMPIEALNDYKSIICGAVLVMSKEEQNIWSAKQAYIALGTALVAAAELRVDSTPMEGFDRDKFDEILGLTAKGLKSSVILAIGHRDASADWLVNLPKVRRDLSALTETI